MSLPFPHKTHIPLSEYSTFGIGGPARYFSEVRSIEEMQTCLHYCVSNALPVHILGKGSNSLFDDRGFNGLVIFNRIDTLVQEENRFRVGSGYSFPRLGGLTARQGFSGLEFASGIPATVGGAIYMNAGANGKSTADTLVEVSFVTESGSLRTFKEEELTFSYRTSPFQSMQGAIVEGVFALTPSETAKREQKELLDYRLKTQPYKISSAGCAFRNPECAAAGQIIEELGLKGMQLGGAAISEQHGNFIVNRGGAKAADVLLLIAGIKEKVYREQGVILEEEVRYIPYDV